MDASEPDHSHEISQGDLLPLRRRRRTVSRAEFAAASRSMPRLDDRKYLEDMDRHVDGDLYEPYDRTFG
ncbi:prevent-host-death protein [Nonomuraea guangzhouensis]|uniref:Prevent-host-death protein n=1 Tax=Nonomuraea guangzhouensis TaxID=1291555 RepID=A0ABW4GZ57_9ACTN|nr:prevent-host-death protein [Nonomuraea guangzhouensis]